MSVADLRAQLTDIAAQLPIPQLSAARDDAESVAASLAAAWRGSEHPSAQTAVTAASNAADCLADIVGNLKQAADDIAGYNERL